MPLRARILVAMSGGVDSSTAAAILKREGHDVIGVGLKLVESAAGRSTQRGCCGIAGMDDARCVAARIGIPFYVLNYEEVFEETVITPFCRSYIEGSTPNPCVECNRAVKFGRLLRLADALRVDRIATGHYARVGRDPVTGRHVLRKGVDADKDQSYFLYSLSQEQLSCAMFPLGEMTRAETRRLAESFGLNVSDKPASQDICFLGNADYRRFLAERSPESLASGPIVDTGGRVLGRHRGIAFYTIGQRKGLGVAAGEPLYVVSVDRSARTVVVGRRDELQKMCVSVRRVNWIAFDRPAGALEVTVKMRYRQEAFRATVSPAEGDRAVVAFDRPQDAAAAGQSAVFYDGDVVVGGGIIDG